MGCEDAEASSIIAPSKIDDLIRNTMKCGCNSCLRPILLFAECNSLSRIFVRVYLEDATAGTA